MSQGAGGGNQGNGGGWPTYPGGPSGPDFRAPGSSDPGPAPQGGWTSSGWTQPLQPTGEPAYPTRPGPPGQLPPRPKSPNNGPVIAVIVAIVVLSVVGAAVLGAAILGAGRSGPAPDPTPAPTTSTSADPTGPTPTPEVESDPIPSAAPGQPPTGDLKARLDARYGTFETIRRSGEGNASFDLPPEAQNSVLWMKTSGPGWYSVKGVFEDTSTTPLIYGESARDGVVPIGIDHWQTKRTIRIEVEARSTWELEIRPISSVPVFTGEASGRGHAVLISDGPARDVQMDYRGNSNFMVKQYGEKDNSHHANEIGDISVPATFEPGLSVIFVEAWNMGTWGIRPR